MEVTHPLLLGPFYLVKWPEVKWPVNTKILAASVFAYCFAYGYLLFAGTAGLEELSKLILFAFMILKSQ